MAYHYRRTRHARGVVESKRQHMARSNAETEAYLKGKGPSRLWKSRQKNASGGSSSWFR